MPRDTSALNVKTVPDFARLCVCVGLTALVCACASSPTTAGTHTVNVTVYPSSASPGPPLKCGSASNGYIICVDEDPIDLDKDTRPIDTVWNLPSGGPWSFDKKGIEIKGGGGWNEHPAGPNQYVARSNSKDGMRYKYTINVVNGSTEVPSDPFIWNR